MVISRINQETENAIITQVKSMFYVVTAVAGWVQNPYVFTSPFDNGDYHGN